MAVLGGAGFDAPAASGLAIVALALLALAGAHDTPLLQPGRASVVRIALLGAATGALAAALHFTAATNTWRLAGGALGGWSALMTARIGVFAVLASLGRGGTRGRILILGRGALATRIAEGVRAHEHAGLRLVGYLADGAGERGEAGSLGPWLGPVGHLEKVLRELSVGRIVVASGDARSAPVEDALIAARLAGIVVESGADCFEWLYGRLALEVPSRQLLLDGGGFEPSLVFEPLKRAGDVVLAIVGLLLASPLLALAALAIKLDSPGPVLFRQVRLGRAGQRFPLWKLRSMVEGAEDAGPALAEVGDPRVTRVGRFLRRTRIDEIPQLWNVLRGDMSLVGPRPERPEFYDELVDRFPLFRHRLAVRPGLTGWAQVQQGYVNDWDGFGLKLSYDLFYLKRRCAALDARVIWRTAWEMVRLKGV